MSLKSLIAIFAVAAGAAVNSGCVATVATPGVVIHSGGVAVRQPAVIVAPAPVHRSPHYHGHRHRHHSGHHHHHH